ncbi:hypothetical protein EDD92_2887 [Streptomyces sp. TLI_185]|nr:hypothetical protein EDD92_2887 [Streptomyces sp. TLI_185]
MSLVVYPDELPVVYKRFVPDSQVTFPDLSFLGNVPEATNRGARERSPAPGVFRRRFAAAVGVLAIAGSVALPAAAAPAHTTAKGEAIANLWDW